MSTKDTLENMAKNTFLAGLGSIDSSKDALAKSIDAAQEKSNSLYNELVSRGGEIQNKLFEKRDELQAKGRKFLGIKTNHSQDEKIEQLNAKVDQLTTAIVALIEKRNAAKVSPKPKTTVKAASKTKATPKPKATTNAKSATKPKAAPKPKTAATPKAPAKPKTAAKPKAPAKPKATAKPKASAKPANSAKAELPVNTDASKKAD